MPRPTARVSIRLILGAMLALFSISEIGILLTQRATTEGEIISGMRSILDNVSGSTLERTDSFLQEAQNDAALTVQLLESGTVSPDDGLEGLFGGILRNSPELSGIFYGTASGEFLFVNRSDEVGRNGFRTKSITVDDGSRIVDLTFRDADFQAMTSRLDPEDTYDPRTRPWYEAAADSSGDLTLTDPYVFFSSQEPGVTAALPVRGEDGDIQGVVGVDVSLSQLSEFLVDLRLGDNGSAFIVNRGGEVIALEDPAKPRETTTGGFRLSTVTEVADPLVAQTFAQGIEDGLGFEDRFLTLEDDAGTTHVSVTPVGSSDWVLGVALSEEDFLGSVRKNQRTNTLIAAAIGLLTVFLAWLLIRNVTQPLQKLRKRAAEIETGVIEPQPPMQTGIAEVQATSDAFDHMVTGLIDQRRRNELLLEDLKGRYEERRQSRELKRANQALQQFAYMASHDLRAPLKKLINLADLAVIDSDGEARKTVQPMRDSAVHLEELVLGYGRLAGIEHGGTKDQPMSIMLEQAHAASDSNLEIDLRNDAMLRCDPVLVTQALVNLLENAAKYGATDEVIIDVRNEGETSVLRVSNAVEQTFSVDGSVFAPFRRLVDDDAGTGLGLAIVERIAHLHGGSVHAVCEDNMFTIEIALAKEGS